MESKATLLIFGALLHWVMSDPHLHQQETITEPSGLYLEGLQPAKRITNQWNILTSFDLQDMYIFTEPLITYYERYLKPRNRTEISYMTRTMTDLFTNDREVQTQWEYIRDYLRPFEIDIGTDHKTYSYIIPQNDANFYDQILPIYTTKVEPKTKNKSTHVTSGIVGLMHILGSQYNVLNVLGIELSNKNISSDKIRVLTVNMTSTLNFIAKTRYVLLQSALNIVRNAKLGIIDPLTFENEHLREVLSQISTSFPPSYIPFPKSGVGLTQLKDIANLDLLMKDGRVIIMMRIPFVDTVTDDIYKIHSHPVLQNSDDKIKFFAYAVPSGDYLWITDQGKRYSFISQQDFSNLCKKVDDYLLCAPPTLFHSTTNNSPCEMILYHEFINQTSLSCEINLTGAPKDSWIPLTRPGSWLYSIIEPINAQLNCPRLPRVDLSLKGYGMLHIEPGCRLKTSDTLLLSNNTFSYNPHIPDIAPKNFLNLTKLLPKVKFTQDQLKFNPKMGYTNTISLSLLTRNLAPKNHFTNTKIFIQTPNIFWKILTVINLCLIICCIGLVCSFKKCKKKDKNDTKSEEKSQTPMNVFVLEPTNPDSMNQVQSPLFGHKSSTSTFRPETSLEFNFSSSSSTPVPETTNALIHNDGYYSIPRKPRPYRPLPTEPKTYENQDNYQEIV